MRKLLAVAAVFLAGSAARAQAPPADPLANRYGVPVDAVTYPQKSPAAAVLSAAKAAERGQAEYLAAHLADPAFIDARVAARAAVIEVAVDRDLRLRRDRERADPNTPAAARLPVDPAGFADAVRAESRGRAFRDVAVAIRAHLAENPRTPRDLRRAVRDAGPTETNDTAVAAARGDGRQVRLVRRGERWFVEDRQAPPVGN